MFRFLCGAQLRTYLDLFDVMRSPFSRISRIFDIWTELSVASVCGFNVRALYLTTLRLRGVVEVLLEFVQSSAPFRTSFAFLDSDSTYRGKACLRNTSLPVDLFVVEFGIIAVYADLLTISFA